MTVWARLAMISTALLAASAAAQSVRGTVVDAGAIPLPGVVIQLLDSSSTVRARALSDERGVFLLVAPTAGTYRVRTLRIGYKPVLSEPLVLAGGQERAQRFELAGIASGLDTVRVGGRNACGRASAEAAATANAWEQIRTAIAATELSGEARGVRATRITYERQLDQYGWRVLNQSSDVQVESLAQPWRAPTPESLHGTGYIAVGVDSTSYRAPGLDMLGSTTFIDDHCFRLTDGKDRTSIGVAFEPTPERRELGEIRGTVFVDRATSELRSMEFRYVHGKNPDLADGAHGSMEFLRLRNGTWLVSRWDIRMPVKEIRIAGLRGRVANVDGAQTVVSTIGVRVAGSELALAMAGRDTLWARPPLVIRGWVGDSATGRDIAGARVELQGTAVSGTTDREGNFALRAVLPGNYALVVHTPALDSMGTASETSVSITDGKEPVRVRALNSRQLVGAVCGPERAAARGIPGIILGQVVGADEMAAPAAKVNVEWTDRTSGATRSADVPTDAGGNFRLCGLPVGSPVTVRAAIDSVRADPQTFVLAAARPVESVRLSLSVMATATAVFTGTVVADSGRAVVGGAELILPEPGVSAMSDSTGAFRLRDIPAGTHKVVVRKLGYGPLETTLAFGGNETVNRRIVLSRITVLNEVMVTARDRVLREFDENRARGLGVFMTRNFLETQEGRKLSMVFGNQPGVWLWKDRNGTRGEYIASSRKCILVITVSPAGGSAQNCAPCYSAVYVDGNMMTRHDRFDINSIEPKDIEAIEYYRGPSETPGRYLTSGSSCGVVVIHTRLSMKK